MNRCGGPRIFSSQPSIQTLEKKCTWLDECQRRCLATWPLLAVWWHFTSESSSCKARVPSWKCKNIWVLSCCKMQKKVEVWKFPVTQKKFTKISLSHCSQTARLWLLHFTHYLSWKPSHLLQYLQMLTVPALGCHPLLTPSPCPVILSLALSLPSATRWVQNGNHEHCSPGGGGGGGGVLPYVSYIGTFRQSWYHFQGPLQGDPENCIPCQGIQFHIFVS